MKDNSTPHAGKHKRWWSRAEALKWILYRGFPNRLPSNATVLRMVVERAAKQHLAVDSNTRLKFGGLHAAKADNELQNATKGGSVRVKEDDLNVRYNVQDVKRLFPSASGPGRGRPKRELLPRREVMALARLYAATGVKLSRENAARQVVGSRKDGGTMGNDHFQAIRVAALAVAVVDADAELRAGLIDRGTYDERMQNIKVQKGPSKSVKNGSSNRD